MLKKLIRYIPAAFHPPLKRIKHGITSLADFGDDYFRFLAHSSTASLDTRQKLASRIIATCHNIEKGLSLPNPRSRFGQRNLEPLLALIRQYGLDDRDNVVLSVRDTLGEYVRLHERRGIDDYPCKTQISALLRDLEFDGVPEFGGLRELTRDAIMQAVAGVKDEFFFQRHSVRQFSQAPVSLEDIDAAVRIAQKAPAVCNRQHGFVHIISDPALKAEVLALQGGSAGFGQEIDKVLVVTTTLTNFWYSGERNQAWIDGGLFAMSLIYGLHARGIGSICLNWSKLASTTRAMRKLIGLSESDVVIMLIGIGHLREVFQVPISIRRPPSSASRVVLPHDRQT
jgi:nitroreductase